MADQRSDVVTAFAQQAQELAELQRRQPRAILVSSATGNGDMDESVGLNRAFRAVFVRCHFSGGTGTAVLTLSLDSTIGSAYDTRLFTVTQAGANKDVHLRWNMAHEPAPWTFQADDKLRFEWVNPDAGNLTWGLEVGLAIASNA